MAARWDDCEAFLDHFARCRMQDAEAHLRQRWKKADDFRTALLGLCAAEAQYQDGCLLPPKASPKVAKGAAAGVDLAGRYGRAAGQLVHAAQVASDPAQRSVAAELARYAQLRERLSAAMAAVAARGLDLDVDIDSMRETLAMATSRGGALPVDGRERAERGDKAQRGTPSTQMQQLMQQLGAGGDSARPGAAQLDCLWRSAAGEAAFLMEVMHAVWYAGRLAFPAAVLRLSAACQQARQVKDAQLARCERAAARHAMLQYQLSLLTAAFSWVTLAFYTRLSHPVQPLEHCGSPGSHGPSCATPEEPRTPDVPSALWQRPAAACAMPQLLVRRQAHATEVRESVATAPAVCTDLQGAEEAHGVTPKATSTKGTSTKATSTFQQTADMRRVKSAPAAEGMTTGNYVNSPSSMPEGVDSSADLRSISKRPSHSVEQVTEAAGYAPLFLAAALPGERVEAGRVRSTSSKRASIFRGAKAPEPRRTGDILAAVSALRDECRRQLGMKTPPSLLLFFNVAAVASAAGFERCQFAHAHVLAEEAQQRAEAAGSVCGGLRAFPCVAAIPEVEPCMDTSALLSYAAGHHAFEPVTLPAEVMCLRHDPQEVRKVLALRRERLAAREQRWTERRARMRSLRQDNEVAAADAGSPPPGRRQQYDGEVDPSKWLDDDAELQESPPMATPTAAGGDAEAADGAGQLQAEAAPPERALTVLAARISHSMYCALSFPRADGLPALDDPKCAFVHTWLADTATALASGRADWLSPCSAPAP
eukprot:TRINITY_DN7693_c0_g1_i2.p1 TRINITY_DN7693_c0_g1~~TRINITY_DN7693_c0_g1_i2.p1  ORF type:complete len:765 (+),score=146.28 TRINITY_DN7693_c0_g1_i2:104-2398(+)